MTCSTSFSSSAALLLFIASWSLWGCAATGPAAAKGGGPARGVSPIAVLPVENLSGKSTAPAPDVGRSLVEKLRAGGIGVIPEETLSQFMARHRLRYTGGIDTESARSIREETGAKAVLVTSFELYNEKNPPRVALTSRLVSAGDNPEILWMDSVALAGEDAPGILGLGLVADPRELRERAARRIGDLVIGFLSEKKAGKRGREPEPENVESFGWRQRRFQPRHFYRSPEVVFDKGGPITVAVVPFINDSDRKDAGKILALLVADSLEKFGNVRVVEPGVLRRELLRFRMVIDEGLNLAQGASLFDFLRVDLICMGSVADFQDDVEGFGNPRVEFFLQVLEKNTRKVIWSSHSYNRGADWVYFFDWGRVYTGEAMASEMARAVSERILGTVQ